MKNFEKYKDKLLDRINVCSWYDYFNSDDDCVQDCKACEERFVKWLFEDSEKPVLDRVEREYLKAVIWPLRKIIVTVSKNRLNNDLEYIALRVKSFKKDEEENMCFPSFKIGTMFKGMELGKKYSLEELGL